MLCLTTTLASSLVTDVRVDVAVAVFTVPSLSCAVVGVARTVTIIATEEIPVMVSVISLLARTPF